MRRRYCRFLWHSFECGIIQHDAMKAGQLYGESATNCDEMCALCCTYVVRRGESGAEKGRQPGALDPRRRAVPRGWMPPATPMPGWGEVWGRQGGSRWPGQQKGPAGPCVRWREAAFTWPARARWRASRCPCDRRHRPTGCDPPAGRRVAAPRRQCGPAQWRRARGHRR